MLTSKIITNILENHCLWKEILSQQRIRHFKILQSIYFAYDVGIISSYSNRIGIISSYSSMWASSALIQILENHLEFSVWANNCNKLIKLNFINHEITYDTVITRCLCPPFSPF